MAPKPILALCGLAIFAIFAVTAQGAGDGMLGMTTASMCPAGVPVVNCLVSPCSTPECQKKCGGLAKCVDNYCGGCNCDCLTTAPTPSGKSPRSPKAASSPKSPKAAPSPKVAKSPKAAPSPKVSAKSPKPSPLPSTGSCPPNKPLVQCLVDPCTTAPCKSKCSDKTICESNYCGGCNCGCCLPENEICTIPAAGAKNVTSCCGGNICDFSVACMTNPAARCAPICVPKKSAYNHCNKGTCAIGKDDDCCTNMKCVPGPNSNSKPRCATCKKEAETCTLKLQDCCGKLVCGSVGMCPGADCKPVCMKL